MGSLRAFHRVAGLLARVVEIIVGAILAVQVGLLFFSAVQNLGGWEGQVLWLEEIARFGLVQLATLGAAVALRAEAHQGVDALTRVFPPRVRRTVEMLDWLIIAAFGAWFAFCGILYVMHTRADGGTLDSISLPKWLFYVCYPLAGLLFTAFGLEKLLALATEKRPPDPPAERAIAEGGA
jgi:TRAP-type C4-dicarboxylate transport system permease small subunit